MCSIYESISGIECTHWKTTITLYCTSRLLVVWTSVCIQIDEQIHPNDQLPWFDCHYEHIYYQFLYKGITTNNRERNSSMTSQEVMQYICLPEEGSSTLWIVFRLTDDPAFTLWTVSSVDSALELAGNCISVFIADCESSSSTNFLCESIARLHLEKFNLVSAAPVITVWLEFSTPTAKIGCWCNWRVKRILIKQVVKYKRWWDKMPLLLTIQKR